MTKKDQIEEISSDLRLLAVSLDSKNASAKEKLIKVAQGLDFLVNNPSADAGANYSTNFTDTSGADNVEDIELSQPSSESSKSKYGIDQEQKRYYKIAVEFLYIPASDNLEARNKISEALSSIPDFKGKVNIGEAQGMSVKEPS